MQIVGYFIYWFIGKDKTTDDHIRTDLSNELGSYRSPS